MVEPEMKDNLYSFCKWKMTLIFFKYKMTSNFSCGSNSINTAVCLFVFCLFVFCSQFWKSVNATSTEARLALDTCTVECNLLCVANPMDNENGGHRQTQNYQPNSRNSCLRIILVCK